MTSVSVSDPHLVLLCHLTGRVVWDSLLRIEVVQSLDSPQSASQWFSLCHSVLKCEVEHMSVTVDVDVERGAHLPFLSRVLCVLRSY